jgi:hypothetical protein
MPSSNKQFHVSTKRSPPVVVVLGVILLLLLMVCSDDGCGVSLVFLVEAAADDESGNTGSSDSSGRSKCLGPAKSGQPLTHVDMITSYLH